MNIKTIIIINTVVILLLIVIIIIINNKYIKNKTEESYPVQYHTLLVIFEKSDIACHNYYTHLEITLFYIILKLFFALN
jgi:hypothetical protein